MSHNARSSFLGRSKRTSESVWRLCCVCRLLGLSYRNAFLADVGRRSATRSEVVRAARLAGLFMLDHCVERSSECFPPVADVTLPLEESSDSDVEDLDQLALAATGPASVDNRRREWRLASELTLGARRVPQRLPPLEARSRAIPKPWEAGRIWYAVISSYFSHSIASSLLQFSHSIFIAVVFP